jgi:membrane protease YdiL (CAAX protease family)
MDSPAAPAERKAMIDQNRVGRFDRSLSLSGLFSGDAKKPTIILLLAPLILTTWKYFGTKAFYLSNLTSTFVLFDNPEQTAELYTFFSAFLLFAILPWLIVRVVFHEKISSYGLQLGDWRFGLKAFLILTPIFVIASYTSINDPEFLAEYPLFKGAGSSPSMFLGHAMAYLFFYIGWEVFFRGFMQFGLRDAMGDWNSILVQTALSCIVHIGKPTGEIYSSILGALIWGILAFRTRSIIWGLLVHWFLGVSLDFFICYAR